MNVMCELGVDEIESVSGGGAWDCIGAAGYGALGGAVGAGIPGLIGGGPFWGAVFAVGGAAMGGAAAYGLCMVVRNSV